LNVTQAEHLDITVRTDGPQIFVTPLSA